jgi:hypothetical protein
MTEAEGLALNEESRLVPLQRVDRVLQEESGGVIEIVVIRGREAWLWQTLAQGEDLCIRRRWAVAQAHFPDFLSDIDQRRCIGCAAGFSRAFLPVDLIVAHAPVSAMLPTAAVLGGVCSRCSEEHTAVELREFFSGQLRTWYPDLRPIEPASLSVPGRA